MGVLGEVDRPTLSLDGIGKITVTTKFLSNAAICFYDGRSELERGIVVKGSLTIHAKANFGPCSLVVEKKFLGSTEMALLYSVMAALGDPCPW
jgi:hypothetical protein